MTSVLAIAIAYAVTGLQARNPSPGSGDPAAVTPRPAAMRSEPEPHRAPAPAVAGAKGTTGPVAPTAVDSQSVREAHEAARPERAYSILVGSFRYEPEAASLIDQLSGLGYRTRTTTVTSNTRGTWHQVFVGPYGDIEQARLQETRVRQLPGYADAHVIAQ